MEIIQQKLVWLLGAGAVSLIILRLRWARTHDNKPAAIKLTAGVTTMALGAIFGILARIEALGYWVAHSGIGFFIETVLGYTLGWCLVIWGIIDWAMEYYDANGNPLTSPRYRRFSEKVSSSLTKEHNADSFLNDISRYLLLALDCQALTLHRKDKNGDPLLTYQTGLTIESENLISRPRGEANLFCASFRGNQAVATDDQSTLHQAALVETMNGPIASALCIPVTCDGEIPAVLTVFAIRKRRFTDDDINMLQIVCSALTMALKRELAEQERRRDAAFCDILAIVMRPFDEGEKLVPAFLRSGRLLSAHVPYQQVNLYVVGNGPITILDFKMPTGGTINIKTGHFSREEYPQLCRARRKTAASFGDTAGICIRTAASSSYVTTIGSLAAPRAYLEIKIAASAKAPAYLPYLLSGLGKAIGRALDGEFVDQINEQTSQWLGAIRYYQDRALATDDLSGLLGEMATLAVNSAPATFCRIILCDPTRQFLRTAALAQIRPLNWQLQYLKDVPVARTDIHRRALLEKKEIRFDQENAALQMPPEEASIMLPAGVKRGAVVPLIISGQPVGLLTAGECRDECRSMPLDLSLLFVSGLAGLVSMILTWHKDKRLSMALREGNKRLIMKQRQAQVATPPRPIAPRMRSRINGPLAGILASCEYLRNNYPGMAEDIERYLNVIQRNASRIHEITAGLSELGPKSVDIRRHENHQIS